MIAVIDLGIGNLQSVCEAFRRVGEVVTVTAQPEDVARADVVVLPGVGAFADGMARLHRSGLVEPLRRHAIEEKKPLLGICLGMQLLAESGEEHGFHHGLGLVRGHVTRLQPTEPGCRVPNMGWCDVSLRPGEKVLLSEIPDGEPFYFAHSYHLECADPSDVVATIEYGGIHLTAAVERENLFGIQFHPEKSQSAGLTVLSSFIKHASVAHSNTGG